MGIQLAHAHQQSYGLLTSHYELFLNGGQSELQPFEKNVAKSIICLSPFTTANRVIVAAGFLAALTLAAVIVFVNRRADSCIDKLEEL